MNPCPRGISRCATAGVEVGENLSGLLSLATMTVASARTSRLACARAARRSSTPRIVSRMIAPTSRMSPGRESPGNREVRHAGAAQQRSEQRILRHGSSARGGRTRRGRRRRGRGRARMHRRLGAIRLGHDDRRDAILRDGPPSSVHDSIAPSAQDRRGVVGDDVGARCVHAHGVAGDAELVAGRERMLPAPCRRDGR
jgi:hypothetical protein